MKHILVAVALCLAFFLLCNFIQNSGETTESMSNMSSCDTSAKRKSCDACTSGNTTGSDLCYWKEGYPGQEGLCESGDQIGDDANWSSGCTEPSPSPEPSPEPAPKPAPTETFNSCALIDNCSTCVSPDTYINKVGRGVCYWKESSYDYLNVFHPASCTSFEDDGTSKECSGADTSGKNSDSSKDGGGDKSGSTSGDDKGKSGNGNHKKNGGDDRPDDDSNKPGPGPGPGPYISRQKLLNCLSLKSDE